MKIKFLYPAVLIFSIFTAVFLLFLFNVNFSDKRKDFKIYDDSGNLRYFLSHSENNEVVATTYYENNKIRSEIHNDIKGRILKEKYFSSNGELLTITNYSYDTDGRLHSKEIFDGDEVLIHTTRYFYDEEGKLSKTVYDNKSENKKTENLIDGKSVVQTIYNDNNIIYSYKDDSDNVKFYRYSENGLISYSYEFNKLKNTTIETIYNEKGNIQTEKTFSKTGLLLNEKQYSGGKLLYTNTYSYDAGGQQRQKLELDDNNNVFRRYIYEYDKYGNRIRIDIYDADGKKIEFF